MSRIPSVKVLKDLPLSEYAPDAPELKQVVLKVWVNPTREVIQSYALLTSTVSTESLFQSTAPAPTEAGEQVNDVRISEWYSAILSQGPEETHMSAEDLRAVFEQDPAMWVFIFTRCWQLIDEHRVGLQKKQ